MRGGVGGRRGNISFVRNFSKRTEPLLGNVLTLLLLSGNALVETASPEVMAGRKQDGGGDAQWCDGTVAD